MFCAVDVHYESDQGPARAACVQFETWSSDAPRDERVVTLARVEPYVPGEFFKRELPPILSVLGALEMPPSVVIVDGYVWLDAAGKRGLGARLHEVLGEAIPIIGVAKTRYRGNTGARELLRGQSVRPLFISAIGLALDEATIGVGGMRGAHRVPTLLQRVDRLARGLVAPDPPRPCALGGGRLRPGSA